MNREQVKLQRIENPAKRDKYLSGMKEAGEKLTEALARHDEPKHTCWGDPEKFCERCSYGQQAAEMVDEDIGIEGIDF